MMRHAAHLALHECIHRHDGRMSAQRGRVRRTDNTPAVLLQARVTPEIREAIQRAAAQSGVSIGLYVEDVFKALISDHGTLPVVESGRPQREELPIPAA